MSSGKLSESNLRELLWKAAEANSDKACLIFQGNHVSYGELYDRVDTLARYLIARGVGPGVFVAIAFERSIDMILAMLAIISAGGAYLPLDIDSPAARINDILRDSQATDMLTTSFIAQNIAFGRDVRVHCIDTLAFEAVPTRDAAAAWEMPELIRPLLANDPPYVIYTSGTTGKPKGVVNTHAGVVNSLRWMIHSLEISPRDCCLLKAPYTFDLSVWEIFVPLAAGGCLVIAEPGGHRNPVYIADLIERNGVTLAYFVPTMLGELLSGGVEASCPLRNVVAIGEALTPLLQTRFHAALPDCTLWNSYGPTEAAVGVTLWRCRRDEDGLTPPLGDPAWNTELYVLDQALNPTPAGQSGEIYIAGLQVASGYLQQPGLTREKFLPCPFYAAYPRMYRTGDFAVRRPDGHIEFLGRQDNQIKLNGIRVEIGDIEAAIASLAGVSRAVVVPRVIQDATMLVAYVVMREGVAPMPQDEFSEALVVLLPSYMVPSILMVIAALPLTVSGKLDVKALPEPEIDRKVAYRAPNAGLETDIAELFSALTGFSPVGANDSFFALGGTSLMAMRLAARLKEKTGHALPMRALVEYPTPASLAAALLQPTSTSNPRGTTVFMFPGAGGDDVQYATLGNLCAPALDLRTIPYADWRTLIRSGATFERIIDQMATLVEAAVPRPDEIRLAGYSLGGDVAYGVARRLEEAGRRIAFLGLIDTDAPGRDGGTKRTVSRSAQITKFWRERRLGRQLRDMSLDRLPGWLLPVVTALLRKMPNDGDLDFQMNKRMMVRLRKSWQSALTGAPPKAPLQGPTTLFRSEGNASVASLYDGWAERCARLTIVPVLGTHLTMLTMKYLDDFSSTYIAAVTRSLRAAAEPDSLQTELRRDA